MKTITALRRFSRRGQVRLTALIAQLLFVTSLVSAPLSAQTAIKLSDGATTLASSQFQSASFAVDGDPATRWESTHAVDPAFLTIDLGQAYNLSQIVIDWEAANAANYTIEGSNNNGDWTTLATRTNGTFGDRTDTVNLSGSYRYVRMNGTARSVGNDWGYSIWEMEVYGFSNSNLPAPWNNGDVGSPLPGSASYSSGVFNTTASGNDIWSTADNFHFVYQPLNGDGVITARINALSPVNPWAKAGVMIRESLAAGAKNAYTAITVANGATFQRRNTAGDITVSTKQASITTPYWVRLARNGNTLTGYISPDGSNWTLLGSDTVAMTSTVLVGLAQTSHDAALIGTAQIGNVNLQTGSIWSNTDVGSPLPGSVNYSGSSFITSASGDDIWNTADNFHFVYQPFNGDGAIIAQVTSLDPTHAWAKAGVMFRENLTGGSKNAMMAMTSSNGSLFQRRTLADATSTSNSQGGVFTPYWVKLTRNGNTLTGFSSGNGSDWVQVGADNVSMADNVFAGLAHTSHDANLTGTAQFDEVTVQSGPVCFYENANFGGASFCRSAEAQNVPSGWTNRISSVRVINGYSVTLRSQANQTGSSVTLNNDTANLASVSFNDLTVSYAITRATNALPAFCARYPQTDGWQSSRVWYSNGQLTYASDAQGNRIPDYSYAGYHYGEDPLPTIPVVTTLGPASGDNTARIQAALDAIGNRAPDANGHRGALQLLPGRYEVYGIVRINKSGVVLRGSGRGTNTAVDTIIYARGNNPHQRTPLVVGTNDSSPWDVGASTNVTDNFVAVGSQSFNVQNAAMFSVGQEVVITHPSSQAWINALGGGGVTSGSWTAGTKDIPYIRRITSISGSRITLDAPIYNHLDRSLTQARVAAVSGRNLIRESGIENLRVDIETAGGEDENHAWSAIGVIGAEDSWVSNVATRYFGYAGVKTAGAIRVTIKDASATNPVGIRTGSRFYNFDVDGYSQLILFTGCHAENGRHNFISNGTMSASGVVWHRCTTSGTNDSEGHRYWSTGMLFDSITGTGSNLKLFNRGDWGTQHGWAAAHSTAWNSQATFFIQKPPTAQNYGISGMGSLSTNYPFPGTTGHVDIRSGQRLVPESLYEAQMCDRLMQ